MLKVQSRGVKYSHHEILTPLRAIEKPRSLLYREGNNSSVCSAVREGTLPGVQPTLLCDKHVIKQIFAQNSYCLQWENCGARWVFLYTTEEYRLEDSGSSALLAQHPEFCCLFSFFFSHITIILQLNSSVGISQRRLL